MTFKPYPKYKASGVEWLGDVPTHWEMIALKRDTEFVTSGSRGWADHYADQGHVFLRIGNLTRDSIDLDLSDIQYVAPPIGSEGDRTRVRAHDLLVSITAYLGSVAVIPEELQESYVSQHVALARPLRKRLLPRWCAYAILSDIGRTHFERQGYGGTKIQLSLEDVRTTPIPAPPFDEQVEIVTFLDNTIAKIDTLIAKQDAMIGLLKEKRQAAILLAVTKGLNPKVLIKPSGVEWLGDVPEHWTICQIKRALSSSDYGISESLTTEGEIPILRMGNIINGKISMADLKFTNILDNELTLAPQDILFNRTNSLALVGKVGMYESTDYRRVGFASYLVRLRANSRAIPTYLTLLFNSDFVLQRARSDSIPAIGQSNLNPTRYGTIKIPLPPVVEQKAIVDYLNALTSKIDAIIAKAQQAIALQKEHRTALISAAIKGKIDVRNQADVKKAA